MLKRNCGELEEIECRNLSTNTAFSDDRSKVLRMSTQLTMKAGSPKLLNTSEKLSLAPVQIAQVVRRLLVSSEIVGLSPISVNLSLDLELNPQHACPVCFRHTFNPNEPYKELDHVGFVVAFIIHMLWTNLKELKLTGQIRLDLNLEVLASPSRNVSH